MHAILLAMTLTAAAPQVEVQTLDGRTLAGTLAELDPQQLAIETDGRRESLATSELLKLVVKDAPAGPQQPARVWVEQRDGSSLVGRAYVAEGDTAKLDLCDGSTVDVPTAGLATVRFRDAPEDVAAEWLRIVDMEQSTDVLVVLSGEVLDYHRGILRNVTASTVEFEFDGEVLPVPRSKVYGLVYYRPPDDAAAEPICQIAEINGSRWSVETFTLADELTWTTPGGVKRTQPLSNVREIDFSRGRIVFLSDLEPESVTFTPYFGGAEALPSLTEFFGLREDRSLRSESLRLGSEQYAKGLAMHSRTKVVYRLPGRFRRFRAVVGIDEAVRPRGNVRLTIHGDDRVLLERDVTGADPPEQIELDLVGVRRIVILADFGEESDVGDHLDLCEARVIK